MSDFIAGVYRFAETANEDEIRQKIAALRLFAERLKQASRLTEGESNALHEAELAIRILEEHLD